MTVVRTAKEKQYYYTREIARQVGVHPNTVLLYEKWHYLPPVPRNEKGYRIFTPFHLEQMKLARIALPGPYPGSTRIVHKLVKTAAAGHLAEALDLAHRYRDKVLAERKHAEEVAEKVETWLQNSAKQGGIARLTIGAAAKLLQVTTDTLRTWERNGLVQVPQDSHNKYRRYSKKEIETLKAVKMLRRAGYSIMAILRMFKQVEAGSSQNIRHVLNTPGQNEDIFYATDRLLTFLGEHEQRAEKIIILLNDMIAANLIFPPAV